MKIQKAISHQIYAINEDSKLRVNEIIKITRYSDVKRKCLSHSVRSPLLTKSIGNLLVNYKNRRQNKNPQNRISDATKPADLQLVYLSGQAN